MSYLLMDFLELKLSTKSKPINEDDEDVYYNLGEVGESEITQSEKNTIGLRRISTELGPSPQEQLNLLCQIKESVPNICKNCCSKINNDELINDDLSDDELDERLIEANIINISANNTLAKKSLFKSLKEQAKSMPFPQVNVDELKNWLKKNYTRKINDTLSNLLATTEIEGFNDDQFDLIKRVFEYKLLQLRAGHDNQLDVSLMDENTYTSTVISPDFEFLKICFPGLNENDVPSSKWRRELIYGVGALARKADGILFNYDNNQEFFIFENIGPPLVTKGKSEGELFRVNLASDKTFAVERILKVKYPFKYTSFIKNTDIIGLLFTVKSVCESNKNILHEYNLTCMETSKSFTKAREWLCLNGKSPQ
ncbi:13696_t:CDS:2 [Entrophospora sp. SA101]|nr:13694_t:CDS:2 [Entrophospora sp. SA101]CAJ0916905.1 13696_t:CDS:2 [Entrophospora sp. SA101]